MTGINLPLAHATIISVLGGTSYGYNTGVISGLNKALIVCTYFPEYTNHNGTNTLNQELSSVQAGYAGILTADILVGGLVGAFVGIPFGEKYGRKNGMFAAGINGGFALLFIFSGYYWINVLIRTFIGIGIGALCTLIPLYITETISAEIRGQVGTLFQVFICFGIVVAQFVNWLMKLNYQPDSTDPKKFCIDGTNWRFQLALGALPSLILALYASCILPESSSWLRKVRNFTGYPESASAPSPVPLLRSSDSSDENQQTVNNSFSYEEIEYEPDDYVEPLTWTEFLFSSAGMRWVRLASGLAISAQLTGINAIMFYSPHIFKDAGVKNVLITTLGVVGVWNFLTVFIATALIERCGRRLLMICGLSFMTLATVLLGISYGVLENEIKILVAVLGIMMFILGFEIGPGGLFYLMASEAFPSPVRDKAIVFANASSWILNIAVSSGFPIVTRNIGTYLTFFLLSIMNMGSLSFAILFLPETKGKDH